MLNRFRRAVSAFRQSPPTPRVAKKAPYSFPIWINGQAQWVMDDFGAYVAEGFDMNAVIYSAVMYKAKAIAKARLRAYTGDPDNPERLPGIHPLAQLVARPNPHQSWLEFQMQREVFLNIAGNSYTWLDRPARNALPRALYNLRPDRVTIVPDTSGVKGYLYTPEGLSGRDRAPMLPQDVIHVKYPNPGDPLEGMGYGLSPLASLAQSGDVDNAITAFLKLFIERGAMTSGILKLKESVDNDEIARIKTRWREQYGGVENWTEIGVLDADSEYQRIGLTFKEMGFDSLDSRNESRMLGPLGVPPQLIFTRYGLERNTFSNAEEARKALWEDTLLPELDLFLADDEYYLRDDNGAFVAYDTSGIPALQQNIATLTTAAKTLFDMGTPRDVAFATVGLKAEPTPDGDVGYLPLSLAPVGGGEEVPLPPTSADEDNATEDTRDGGAKASRPLRQRVRRLSAPNAASPPKEFSSITAPGWSENGKAQTLDKRALWAKADRIAADHEPEFRTTAQAQFRADQREVLAIISAVKRKSLRRKAAIMWDSVLPDVHDVLAAAGERWRDVFTPLIRGVVEDAAGHWQTAAGLAFNVRNLEAEAWFVEHTLQFSAVIQDTSEREIAALLQQATREGWSVPQMQDGLTQMFEQWIGGSIDATDFAGERLPPYRTEVIARTSTMQAYNAGSTEIYRANGVKQHEWLSTIDDRARDSHVEANGQIVDIDFPFVIGGYELMYPGDTSLGADLSEIVNCRCSTAPVIE